MSVPSQGGGIDGAALVEGRDERFANVVVCVFLARPGLGSNLPIGGKRR